MDRAAGRLIFLVLIFQLGLVDMAENPFPACFNSSYAPNSTFDHNLHRVLASLAANSFLTGYYNATAGKSPDQVYGWVQCRGDVDGEVCQTCATDATLQIVQFCPYRKAALISFHLCIMYYYGSNFTIPDWIKTFALPSAGAIPNPVQFKPLLSSFFQRLAASAIINPSGRFFWGDKFKYTDNITIYGTVECARFLSIDACKLCLQEIIGRMLRNYSDRRGAAVYNQAVCYIRYDTFPFFTPLVQTLALSSASYISSNCSAAASSNVTGTPYHRNLKVLLLSLIENGPLTGFFNQTVGTSPDQVYGEVLCRGDVPGDVCWNCTAQASAKILQLCPNSKVAIIWLDYCQLRYSNVNLQGIVDVDDKACQPDPENAPSPTNFGHTLSDLISFLSSYATHGSSGRMFAIGTSQLAESQSIYALAQCTIDISADQCGWCLQNAVSDIAACSMGKQGARILRGSCRLAYALQPFFLGNEPLVMPPSTSGHGRRKPWWILVIVIAIGGVVLAAAACRLWLLRFRRSRLEKLRYEDAEDAGNPTENEADYDLSQISLRTIQNATNNFSEVNKLGEGGFGPVYKGKLPNGQVVAVKRMSRASGQGLKEFRNEVKLIAKLQHSNLVRLIGCCLEKGEKLLIYEYMPNKSLDYFLMDPENSILLDWEKRYNIIIGIARGIVYLHQDSRLNVIHRDLKAGNVLLDEQMNPKISDFGMARIFTGIHGQASTSVVVGTYGYMAPEYALDGLFSIKSDVYSFGILLLEIISGQLNSKFQLSHPNQNLIVHAWSLWTEGNASEFIDPVLRSTSSRSEMLRCMHIALLCIQEDAASRPTMSTVVLMLSNNSLTLTLPNQPAFSHSSAPESSQSLSFLTGSSVSPS